MHVYRVIKHKSSQNEKKTPKFLSDTQKSHQDVKVRNKAFVNHKKWMKRFCNQGQLRFSGLRLNKKILNHFIFPSIKSDQIKIVGNMNMLKIVC